MDYRKYTLANSIGYKITSTSRLVINRLNLNFKNNNYPVNHEQWSVLIRLWEEDGLTQNKLASLTGRDQPSISRLINNLEKIDLVKRVEHPVDKRTKLIFLTAKGKKTQVGLIEQAIQTIDDISVGIDPDELKTFIKVINKIQDNLK